MRINDTSEAAEGIGVLRGNVAGIYILSLTDGTVLTFIAFDNP